jgi:diguanylate cyclase (GGDEF)-like protein
MDNPAHTALPFCQPMPTSRIIRPGLRLAAQHLFRAGLLSALAVAPAFGAGEMDAKLSRLEALARHQPAEAESELRQLSSDPAPFDPHTHLRIELIRLLIADSQYRPDDVLALADRIEKEAAEEADASARALIAHARAGAYYQLGRSDEAFTAVDQEIAQARISRQDDPMAQALLDRARFLMKRGDFEQACASIADAERHVRSDQTAAEVAFSNALLADAIGDAELALRSYRGAYDKFHTVDDRTGEADSQAGAGAALRGLGRSAEAVAPLRQAILAYRDVGDQEGEAIARNELALAQADLGRPDSALAANAEAIRGFAQVHSPRKFAQAQVDRAQLLLQLKRVGEAWPLIEHTRAVALQSEDLQLQVRFHSVGAQVLAALGRYHEAFDEDVLARRAQRKRTDQLVARQLAAQRGRLESEVLTRENSLLRSEAEASQRALEQARRATRLEGIVSVLAASLLLVGLFALWRQRVLLKRIERMAETDPLTGVSNRRQVFELGQRLMLRCRQDGRPYSMLLLDLDGFKQVNDQFGHAAGDAALRTVTDALRRHLRPGDHLGRYGGEEFAVILPGADAVEAKTVAERLRAAVAAAHPDWAPNAAPLTLSGGIAFATPERSDFSQLLVRADQALYRAKHAGRNRIEVAPA